MIRISRRLQVSRLDSKEGWAVLSSSRELTIIKSSKPERGWTNGQDRDGIKANLSALASPSHMGNRLDSRLGNLVCVRGHPTSRTTVFSTRYPNGTLLETFTMALRIFRVLLAPYVVQNSERIGVDKSLALSSRLTVQVWRRLRAAEGGRDGG